MLIKDILRRENNNFDILRLVAASAVIVGHSRTITGDSKSQDLVLSILHFDYSGSLAVKFFFLLSGLVVTNSLLTNPGLRRFMAARIARIFPALATVLMLSAYVMGPILTSKSVYEYLSNPATINYVYSNVGMTPAYQLPGVFADMPQNVVNGSIWSIPAEFFCYALLAIVSAAGLSKNRIFFSLVLAAFSAAVLTDPACLNIFKRQIPSHSSNQMIVFFAIGALLAAWKDKVSLRLEVVAGLLIATYVFRHTSALPYVACLAIFAAAIWASTTRVLLCIRFRGGDFSYGTYLAGWPIQQLVHAVFPHMGAVGNWAISLPLAIGFGALSWYVIEKPAMQLGKRMGQGRSKIAPGIE